MVSAPGGVVEVITLQYELTGLLPRRDAEDTVLAYAPTDRRQLRSYTDTLGSDVTVYYSASLARNIPDTVWYRGHPVGTFAVYLQRVAGDSKYFGAVIGTGVDEDDNDPGRIR
jgi:hypothetical protein